MKPSLHNIAAAIDGALPFVDPAWAKLVPMLNPADWSGKETPEREWAIDGWIPLRQASYLTGPGSAGKSLLSQQLCTCIALGLPFMGLETRQAAALYVSCEDDGDELHRRHSKDRFGLREKPAELAADVPLTGVADARRVETPTPALSHPTLN